MRYFQNTLTYQPLSNDGQGQGTHVNHNSGPGRASSASKNLSHLTIAILVSLTAVVSFTSGRFARFGTGVIGGTAPRIPAADITGEFIFSSPFSKEPPKQGNLSEPIWDALIPNGLGYFRDGHSAPKISIPTVFHQLHCLYVLRRAYYSQSDELEEFDFGKNRSHHAGHCFDYLEQSITCASDSTVEPGEDDPNGFLGSGFPRQCRDFEGVKEYVEKWRVFNATGFLAQGLDHGKAHVD